MVFDSRAWVLLVLPLLGCASEVLPAGSAIVDGDVAEDLTGVVALLDDTGEAFCSGVAIADDHVLTAAHCVEGWEPGELRVRVDHGPGDSTVVAILTVLVDPAFDPASLRADLALLQLAEPLGVPPLAIASASAAAPSVGERVRILGYGVTGAERSDGGTRRSAWADILAVDELEIHHALATCHGDSGGAVVRDTETETVVIAIVSSGPRACDGPGRAIALTGRDPWWSEPVWPMTYAAGGCAVAARSSGESVHGLVPALLLLLVARRISRAARRAKTRAGGGAKGITNAELEDALGMTEKLNADIDAMSETTSRSSTSRGTYRCSSP